MKKKMLMLLTSMLLVCMMAANIAYAATADGTDTASDTVTRAQWLSRLADTFGFEVDQDNYPDNYYADITSDSEYYSVIMMATEFGVLDIEAGENVYPDQPATREFAAQTLNYCLGFQLDSTEYTYSDSADTKYPADIQVAVNRGWFTLEDGKALPAQNITTVEMTAMLADAAAIQESTVVDDNHDDVYKFADFVKVMSKTTQASVDENDVVTIKSAATKIEKGDTFAVWPSSLPAIYVAESVTVADGVTTITTSEADTSKAIVSVDASGNVSMDLSQFQEADGVSVQYSQAGDSASLAGITTDSNSVTASKDITLSNGAKASIKCELSGLTLSQNINTANHTFYVSIKGKSNISSTVTLDAVSAALGSSSVTLGSVRVAGVGTIKLSVDLALNGKITASYAGSFETGMQYSDKDGFRITKSFQKESFTTTAEANASLGVKLEAGLDVYVVKGTLYAKTGISAKFKSSNYSDGKTPKNCTQISAWLYVSVGAEASVNILVWSKSWTKDLIVYDETNSPVRLSFHYEDGKQVSACSRKDSGSKASTKYITSGDSKYGTSSYGDVSSKGTDSEGNEITLWEYTISDDYATITAYKGNAKAVAVPQVLDGYKVTKIDYGAFKNNRNIVRVSIPEGVESIDHYVFSGCTALKSVTLPETLTSIGSRIIENTAIESITIPKGVVKSQNDGYGNGSLVNCKTLKTVIFEDGMITIPAYVCLSEDYTSYIETVVIPDTIENIGGSAFSGCDHLKEITIPEGVVTIGAYAFEGCKSVDSLVIPKTVTTIGSSAFQGCTLLESVTMQENNKTGFKVVIDSSAFSGCVGLEKVSLPRNVRSVGSNTFSGCTALESIVIPEGVESIDSYVFSGCTALKSVTLPETLTSIGSRIIENTAIESITIPKGVVKSQNDGYGNGSLVNCKTLKTVIFEDGMITIPAYVCLSEDYTSYIETVVIPDTIENIGGSAFSGCDHLKEITIPEGVVTIGAYAFEGCKSVDSLVIPKTVTTIGSSAFQGCTLLESVTMQENNKTGFKVVIDSSAFSGCVGLEKVSLPRNVRSVGSNTFSGCTALESIVIPEGVESIDSYVFSGCTALKSVTLPETLTSIGSRIIENTAIESITIPKGVVKSQNDGYGNGSLVNCKTLKTVIFEDGMITIPAYVCLSEDYTSYIETVVIPDTIENIGGSAFSGCDHLKEITIPEGVVTIGAYAFEGCKSVDSLVIPKTVTTIGSSAFQGCALLESVTMQENNKTGFKVVIDSSAFSGCVGLEKVSLPRNVRSIGSNTFSGCTALESIVIPEGVESIDSYVFSGCTALKSVTFPETLTSVGYRIIEDTAVESITIPKNVTKCDYNSSCGGPLYGCKTLKNVVFEEGMTAIPAYACCYAAYLESVTIPSTVTSIGSCAFSGCTNLKTVNYLGTADTWKNVTIGTGNDALVAEIISYHTHKYDQQEVVAPTCTTAGYTLHTCSACGNTYKTDSKAALGHTEVVTAGKDATCTEDGISEGITCSVCGLVIKAQTTIPAKGHDYKEKITKKATCETDGTATYTCTVCGDTYDDVIKATGHDFSITKVTKEATCVEDGIRTLYCSACGTSKEETIPATGEHTYKDTIVPGTCKDLGYTLHECTVCGDSYKDTYTPMGDHTWDEGVITKEATTTETGIKTYTCTVCGETKTEIIPVKTPDPDPEKPTTEEPTTETPTTEEPTTETPTTEEPSTEEIKKSQKFVGTDSYTVTVGDGAFALDVDLAEGDGALTFETSDENVVRVSSRGLVTVNGAGTATITVNAAETKAYYSAVFTITVTVKQKTIIPDPEPEKPTTEEPTTEEPTTEDPTIEVTKKTQKFTGTDSYTKTDGDGAFALDVDLADGDGALTFVSSDDKVVKVSSRGLATVVGAGTAKITVNAAETTAYYSATFTISVTVKSKPVTPPKPAVLKNQVITARNITKTYTAAAFGLGAKTNGNGKLTYKSSNTGIARVNSKGRVSLKGYGKVKITINAAKTSSYKAASKTITITVKPKKMALTSVKSSRAKTMTVKWKRDSKASMYCIRYSTDKRFKKGVKTVWITRNSATSVTLGRLKPRTKYYVRIAAVKKSGSSKLAGAYSAVKAVTVKK